MNRTLSTVIVLVAISLLLVCASSFAADYNFTLPAGCTVNGSHTISGHCDAPTPPPPVTGSCTQGAAGDVAGYTAQCGGTYRLHSGGQDKVLGPTQYTYSFVFGDSWPGDTFGATRVFTIKKTQFLAIPFKPTPGHTVSFNANNTYMPYVATFSVSTAPGLFNSGVKGNGVMCVKTNNPTLKVSSNGSTTSDCVLNPNTTYWFNAVAAKYGTSGWYSNCDTAQCNVAVTLYSVN